MFYADPCSAVKCEQDEVCVAHDDETGVCVKKSNLEVKHVARREMPTFCGTEECRFGECEVLNATTFVCHCTKVTNFFKIFSFLFLCSPKHVSGQLNKKYI